MKNILNKSPNVSTFLRYVIIGVSSFVLEYMSFYLLESLGLTHLLANMIAVSLVMIFNFLMQNYWTFKAGGEGKFKKSAKYIGLNVFNYLFNITIFPVLFDTLKLESLFYKTFLSVLPRGLITKAFITGMIVCWNFFLFKYWVFKKDGNTLKQN